MCFCNSLLYLLLCRYNPLPFSHLFYMSSHYFVFFSVRILHSPLRNGHILDTYIHHAFPVTMKFISTHTHTNPYINTNYTHTYAFQSSCDLNTRESPVFFVFSLLHFYNRISLSFHCQISKLQPTTN
jgi:hypothetical protein